MCMTPVPNGCETPTGERAQRGTHTEGYGTVMETGVIRYGRSSLRPRRAGRIGRCACSGWLRLQWSRQLCEANHESFRVRDFEVPFSPFGIPKRGGRKTLLNKIPAEAVYSTNAENHPNRTIPRTAGYVAKIDNTLAGAHRCKGRIGPAIRDVEPKLLIEGHRFADITYRQRQCADVVDRPR